MLLGALLLAVAAVALVAGSALAGAGVAAAAESKRWPAAPIRSAAIGLAGALAATLVAVGQDRTAVAAGLPFGAAMFLLASAFGASALLARRPAEVREPVMYAAPAAGIVLAALSTATDRAFTRGEGLLLTIVFVPYLVWVAMEPGRDSPPAPGAPLPPLPPPLEHTAQWTPPPEPGAAATTTEVRARIGPAVGRALAGLAVVVGGAFALVEGTTRIAERAPLLPGFAGAALAGSLAALPFTLLVVFPRRAAAADADVGGATLTVMTGLVTLVPGLAALVRPYELDGPAAISVLAVAVLYALSATWMLTRGRSDRVMGALVLAAYAACLLYAGSL